MAHVTETNTVPGSHGGHAPGTPAAGGGVVIDSVTMDFAGPAGTMTALSDVRLSVESGEFVCIVGPSGCGKTTLLRLIQGLETATSGRVSVAGDEPGKGNSSFVFQKASLFPWRTVRKNVSYGLRLRATERRLGRKFTRAEISERVDSLLRVTDLTEFANYYPWQISGGMQQRVNLARALATEPKVLLMDEPFSALDAMTRERLQLHVQDIQTASATTTVFITHDIREAVFLADRVAIMSARPGQIVDVRTVDEPRPRTAEFQQSDKLANLAREMWRILHPDEI